ncbi:PaaI family thioesterase [Salinisphaera sp.]|uniref:PaaI family thioesterase n=1 Tax=Salinisphaera sp. TaxID=1914330 RepID=UPI000C682799|nr:PaaI family thioesterase [Salinisphaera sp.]MBS63372.1 thioesterase [Salinisphaera sp.]
MSLKDAGQIETVIRRNVGSPGQPAFRVLAVGSAHADICLPYDEGMTRLGDTISGPVLMTAADAAMYAAIIAHVPDGEYAVTSHFNIDFLRRPKAADVLARATLLRVGRRTVTCRVELFSQDFDTLVAHVTGAYARMNTATSGTV